VYKGRWAGRDVAVKVIEHESASTVENEVRHPWLATGLHHLLHILSSTCSLPVICCHTKSDIH
jgi:hypothetical protein